jgi:signal transduction histidine kinase
MKLLAQLDSGALIAGRQGGKQTIKMLSNGRWSELPSDQPLPDVAQAMVVDRQGRLWIAAARNVFRLERGHLSKTISLPGDYGVIQALTAGSRGILIATTMGLAVAENDTLHRLTFGDPQLARGLTGAVEDHNGDVWINGVKGIVRIPSGEFKAGVNDERHHVLAQNVIEGDFVGPASLTTGNPSVAIDARGKLWFATINGVVSLDPGIKAPAFPPPLLSVTSIMADHEPLDNKGSFPPRVQALQISYRGVNLRSPEKVIYRYKLDGVDRAWQEVGHRSDAIYTDVSPGKFTFHVMASNGDGIWSNAATTQTFTVRPTFYQSWWFMLLEVAGAALFVWVLLEARMNRLAHAVRVRAQERADERIRIARELHDTLLQGVQGLLMTFHVAAQEMAPNENSRVILDRALSSADKLIIEGRNRVNNLRSEHFTDEELVESLRRVGQDLNVWGSVSYEVNRIGIDAFLNEHVAIEVFYIAREAITNAFRHSRASEIGVELRYDPERFLLVCRDNGDGFEKLDDDTAGEPGHWGLRGMAERAGKIGAQFRCQSASLQGTQISVVIPNRRAYQRKSRVTFLLARFSLGRDRQFCDHEE